jgi:hypothetical protein
MSDFGEFVQTLSLATIAVVMVAYGANLVDSKNMDVVTIKNAGDHSYVLWKNGLRGGIIHNPDCTCREKNKGWFKGE